MNYKGLEIEIDGWYQPEEKAPPVDESFEIHSVVVDGINIFDWLNEETLLEIEEQFLRERREI